MHKTNRAQQVAANAVIRERIELIKDESLRFNLHRQHSAFVMSLNLAFEGQHNQSLTPIAHPGGGL